jgi:AraC-like DNA-binding protein
MLFSFSLKSAFLLFFFLLGILFFLLNLIKGLQNNSKSSYWLSVFTFLCVLYISPFMLGYAGWYSRNPYRDFLFYVPFQQVLIIPPALYFYYKSTFDTTFQFNKAAFLHFLPGIMYLLYALVVYIFDHYIFDSVWFYKDEKDKDFSFWYQCLGFFSLMFYTIKSYTVYNQYKIQTYNTISYADTLAFKWAKHCLIALFILLAFRGFFFIINPEWAEFGRKFWYYLAFSFMFIYISFNGFIHAVRVTIFDSFLNKRLHASSLTAENVQVESFESKKPETILNDLAEWKERLDGYMMESKAYENPDLSIYDLSLPLNIHVKKLSQVINQGYNMNFNDYINQYRVKAVIKQMEAGNHTIQTLLSLAYECGFNSKSTFNRSFKRWTSTSPNDYIKKFLK